MDTNGKLTSLEPGTVEITGKYNGISTPPFSLTVASEPPARIEPTLVGVRIQRPRKELTANERIPLRLRGNYSDGTEKPVVQNIQWQTSDPAVGRIDSSGQLETLKPGEIDVVANVAGIKSAPLHFLVRGPAKTREAEASAQKTYGTAVNAPAARPAPPAVPPTPAATSKAIPPPQSSPARENAAVNVTPYLSRAKDYRVQGNYSAALGELEKARALDDANTDVRKEMDQTRRACNAEKRLGRYDLQC